MATLDKKPRLKNLIRKKPYFETIAPGVSLGYRRNQGAVAWCVRVADGKGGNWMQALGTADDIGTSNGGTVLNYAEALKEAATRARVDIGSKSSSDTRRPLTVNEAIDGYEADLISRGAVKGNATTLRFNMTPKLGAKPVAKVTDSDLRNWRNDLVTVNGVERSSADRIGKSMKACLNLAARNDKRIGNAAEWRDGLAKLAGGESRARDVYQTDDVVQAIVSAAYDISHVVGVWTQTLSETGNRESQIRRVEVIDLQTDRANPRLMVPSSRKGRNRTVSRKPLPITAELAKHLAKRRWCSRG